MDSVLYQIIVDGQALFVSGQQLQSICSDFTGPSVSVEPQVEQQQQPDSTTLVVSAAPKASTVEPQPQPSQSVSGSSPVKQAPEPNKSSSPPIVSSSTQDIATTTTTTTSEVVTALVVSSVPATTPPLSLIETTAKVTSPTKYITLANLGPISRQLEAVADSSTLLPSPLRPQLGHARTKFTVRSPVTQFKKTIPLVKRIGPNCSQSDENCIWQSDTQLVITTPDGIERTFMYRGKDVGFDNIGRILQKLCRQVGLEGPMKAVVDTPSNGDAGSKSSVIRPCLTNGQKDEAEGVLYTTVLICEACNSISEDHAQCQVCRRKFTSITQKSSSERIGKTSLGDRKKYDRKCKRKRRNEEPVCLSLISSDEEGEESDIPELSLLKKYAVVVPPVAKEPIITEETESPVAHVRIEGGGVGEIPDVLDSPDLEKALLQCRSVRIGSYKAVPEEKVMITEFGLRIRVPSLKTGEIITLNIYRNEIVKVLAHFGKQCPVLFYYTTNRAGIRVRTALHMPPKAEIPYFDPTSKEEMHRRITLLPDKIPEETRLFLKCTYDDQCLIEELTNAEANSILVRAAPQDVSKQVQNHLRKDTFQSPQPPPSQFPGLTNIQTIMIYPPPPMKGGISINTEDYACLGEYRFLNDVIIDFYLKYLVLKVLSPEDQKRTHVFSSFFYKRLTTASPQGGGGGNKYTDDPKLTPAERRHARVKGWTKSVDIFSKDFIIIPINENSHWILGIVCFPGLTQAVRLADGKSVVVPSRRRSSKCGKMPSIIGATTITMVSNDPQPIMVEGDEERDEAEGDEDDLEPNSSDDDASKEESGGELMDEATHPPKAPKKEPLDPIKQPCILIFDSFVGTTRSRVCATLREYLQVEWNVRHKGRKRDINTNTMKASVVKVPQQTNYTDCGLYVLQFVEAFFENPITDYRMPIKQLQNWFDTDVVCRKRYQIQQLLHKLMEEQNVDISRLNLPQLGLSPEGTGRGSLSDEEMDDEENMMAEEEEDEMMGEEDELEGLHGEEEDELEEEEDEDLTEQLATQRLPAIARKVLPSLVAPTVASTQTSSPSSLSLPSPSDEDDPRMKTTIRRTISCSTTSLSQLTASPPKTTLVNLSSSSSSSTPPLTIPSSISFTQITATNNPTPSSLPPPPQPPSSTAAAAAASSLVFRTGEVTLSGASSPSPSSSSSSSKRKTPSSAASSIKGVRTPRLSQIDIKKIRTD